MMLTILRGQNNAGAPKVGSLGAAHFAYTNGQRILVDTAVYNGKRVYITHVNDPACEHDLFVDLDCFDHPTGYLFCDHCQGIAAYDP